MTADDKHSQPGPRAFASNHNTAAFYCAGRVANASLLGNIVLDLSQVFFAPAAVQVRIRLLLHGACSLTKCTCSLHKVTAAKAKVSQAKSNRGCRQVVEEGLSFQVVPVIRSIISVLCTRPANSPDKKTSMSLWPPSSHLHPVDHVESLLTHTYLACPLHLATYRQRQTHKTKGH